MDRVTSLRDLRQKVLSWRRKGLKIGLVPTMGSLHTGHLSLVKHAKSRADKVVVSVFVNPLQFEDKTDLLAYPRTLEADIKKLSSVNCDMAFTPDVDTIYPNGMKGQSKVTVPTIGERLCGHYRPGHFEGVATIVSKLFNMVAPDSAVFGEKDYQQLLLIKKLTQDLNMPIEIIASETYREQSGLAMSSRNQYLSSDERMIAAGIYQMLQTVKLQLHQSEQSYTELCTEAKQVLKERGFAPEYVEICRESDLMPANHQDKALRIMMAVKLGETRLIDNIACHLD
ncbi:MAG: pantoate--beta-alanine ligase [Methylophagaceae bacterium]|jgi:pantoate--beta-alanine ligase